VKTTMDTIVVCNRCGYQRLPVKGANNHKLPCPCGTHQSKYPYPSRTPRAQNTIVGITRDGTILVYQETG